MIEITLTFTESDLNSILDAANTANFTDQPPLTVDQLSKRQLADLKRDLQKSAGGFVDEIVDGSEDACANEWLSDWASQED